MTETFNLIPFDPPILRKQQGPLGSPIRIVEVGFPCVDPSGALAALDATGTLWRLTFDVPMLNNPPLRWAGTYEIEQIDNNGNPVQGGHRPRVLSAAAENALEPTYVDLTTEETRINLTYRLVMHRLEVA